MPAEADRGGGAEHKEDEESKATTTRGEEKRGRAARGARGYSGHFTKMCASVRRGVPQAWGAPREVEEGST